MFLNCHANMSLTTGKEKQNTTFFLGVQIIRENGEFTTSVYPKPTFSRVNQFLQLFTICL